MKLPDSVDTTSPVFMGFDLVELDTPDGVFRFLLGTDGIFKDVNGVEWIGSTVLAASSLEASIDGRAPAGELTLTYFQDPEAPNLISQ